MAKGFRVKYGEERFTFGSSFGPDRSSHYDRVAIYVPKERLLIIRDPSSDCLFSGDPLKTYTACVGAEAEKAYKNLLKELGKKKGGKPKESNIPDSVVEWGKAVAVAKNAPEKVCKLLCI